MDFCDVCLKLFQLIVDADIPDIIDTSHWTIRKETTLTQTKSYCQLCRIIFDDVRVVHHDSLPLDIFGVPPHSQTRSEQAGCLRCDCYIHVITVTIESGSPNESTEDIGFYLWAGEGKELKFQPRIDITFTR